jgi:LysM repeat protein
MSRRDTIIIAVLLNAGLLIVLFATSLKSDTTVAAIEPQVITPNVEMPRLEEALPTSSAPMTMAPTDELDAALKQYVTPMPAGEAQMPSSFAADLQSVTQTPATFETSELAFKEVKVKKGDVLERIARHNQVTVDEIMKANQMTSTRLKIGQVLKVPSKSGKSVATSQAPAGDKYYLVKNGDNPWTIAVKNHMKVEELLKLNNLDETQAKRLKPGDKLRIN